MASVTVFVHSFGSTVEVEITQAQVAQMVKFLQTVCHETCLCTDVQRPRKEDLLQDLGQLVITKEDTSKLLASINPALV